MSESLKLFKIIGSFLIFNINYYSKSICVQAEKENKLESFPNDRLIRLFLSFNTIIFAPKPNSCLVYRN
ncbi:hypothetical protein BpHYR1_041488 [Brachionus plicatilis]|uniref:Uncharacterized protein n=1 Tax=Brachionus plicatilis TaxID=10195 RepID=A0A3M7PVY5_BRAPC|nr:hypothetical protein BpHYR1_041488 [Brachionus plicatilis]